MLLSKATYSNSVHTLMVVTTMQDPDQHNRSFGVRYLAQGHVDMQTRGIEPPTIW